MSLLDNNIILSQIVSVKKKYRKEELLLLGYFVKTTKIASASVLIRDNFLFFLVRNEDYGAAKASLKHMRQMLNHYKVVVIREEKTLVRLIFSFFPDTYIHDIHLSRDASSQSMVITLFFILDMDRGIAIGNRGCYINAINFIFNNVVIYQFNDKRHVKIQCKKILW